MMLVTVMIMITVMVIIIVVLVVITSLNPSNIRQGKEKLRKVLGRRRAETYTPLFLRLQPFLFLIPVNHCDQHIRLYSKGIRKRKKSPSFLGRGICLEDSEWRESGCSLVIGVRSLSTEGQIRTIMCHGLEWLQRV